MNLIGKLLEMPYFHVHNPALYIVLHSYDNYQKKTSFKHTHEFDFSNNNLNSATFKLKEKEQHSMTVS